MDIKNRVLNMEAVPVFEKTVMHGEIPVTEPDWDLTIEVTITYYDGRTSKCLVPDKESLAVLNLYHKNNMEAWANNEEYD